MVRFGSVAQYHTGQQEYLLEAAKMSDDPEDREAWQIRQIMPIPTKWVPIFMDNPSFEVSIPLVNYLVNSVVQEQLDDYAPFIYMMATTSCALHSNSDTSAMAIEASRLIYKTQVQSFAERLWRSGYDTKDDADGDGGNKIKGSDNNGPPMTDAEEEDQPSNSNNEEDKNNVSDPSKSHVGGAKSQQPNAVTLSQRAPRNER